MVVGHGAREAREAVVALAEHLGAPVLTTFKAKGLVPDTHPLGAGVLGRSGTPVASWLMNESDLVIAVGVSFSNHTGVAEYKPIIQVDDAPDALGRFHPVAVPLLGDADVTARLLHERTASKGRRAARGRRGPLGDLAGREDPAYHRGPRTRGQRGRRLRDVGPPPARRRGRRRGRRQPRLLARPLSRVRGANRC